jgi:hypothetical protein
VSTLISRLAVNAPEEEQTNLVGALRETVRDIKTSRGTPADGIDSSYCTEREIVFDTSSASRAEVEKRQHVPEWSGEFPSAGSGI